LLNSAEGLVHVDNVLMDREFDSQHVLEMLSQRGLSYVVPKRMQTSEKAQAKRLLQRDRNRYETDRKLHLGKNFGLRFFYFAFACLLYSIWRAVDLLVQVALTGEYKHSPIVTADNTLTLLKKETGIG
jgi:IS4 transposase